MMTSVQPSGATAGAVGVGTLTSVSSEELLQYGADMTAYYDGQITDSMNEMRDALAEGNSLSERRQALQQIAAELTSAAGGDDNKRVAITEEQFERLRGLGLLDALGIDPNYVFPTPEQLEGPAAAYAAAPPQITLAVIDKADAQLALRQDQINSAQDQRMLVLQETMRQRSQVVQLLSNILRERGETMGQVVRNIA